MAKVCNEMTEKMAVMIHESTETVRKEGRDAVDRTRMKIQKTVDSNLEIGPRLIQRVVEAETSNLSGAFHAPGLPLLGVPLPHPTKMLACLVASVSHSSSAPLVLPPVGGLPRLCLRRRAPDGEPAAPTACSCCQTTLRCVPARGGKQPVLYLFFVFGTPLVGRFHSCRWRSGIQRAASCTIWG